ncbi:alpha-N-arabinofuranosidase [Leeuwenhoekiella aestuarii]|uniref:non-reducing end alpha-L-arabinofuranosidase n=1 Tax=Leeuwenhoekiella aestuarii TaxID=2249426 RepID=A0A4Q0NZN4_9FLAO|nr:alpha-L-arabinofuranosidase C-terminal domain-containing protein [Leeuwenhoekiella aestuarii]RXG16108.1 alpha-N-arabinofuranosidase [Leeuwenhoekiella aestuarii]RXG16802.1 alpha-N-arabinofuranosidase [Leeuwenhoekiella aestuarii]
MKNKLQIIGALLVALSCFSLVSAQDATIRIIPSDDAPTISRHIYGHFAEHLGRCIYDGLYVGEKSNIPNTEGVRNDIINALKELKIPNLRWPGGCFADTYHWKDGVGPQSERPTIVNTWWGNVTEDNSFGTHNFLNLCEELGAEPYLAGNVGSGEVQELADWVQYVNFDGISPMSDWRKENGRDKPWGVKYWGVGNEAWGCGGNMRVEYYADIYRKYATFMSDAGLEGGLYKIASGASNDDYHWTEVLMRDIPHNLLQGVALHHYSVIDWNAKGPSVGFSEEQYFKTMEQAWLMEELVTKHVEIMDKYDPKGKVDLVVDEWGGWYDVMEDTNPGFLYQQNTMRDAMIAGMTLNIFHNHARRVKMANLAQVVNVLQAVILTEGEKMILTPTYHVMKMYNVHQDAQLIPIELATPDYAYNDEKLPAVNASASKDAEGKVHISLVNIDANKSNTISVDVSALKLKGFTAEILTSKTLEDHNTFESPEKIQPEKFKKFKLKKGILEVELPPFSVVVLEGN